MLRRNFVIVARRAPREGEDGTQTPTPTPTITPPAIVFTTEQQAKLNELLAAERKKVTDSAQKANQTLVGQLEELKNNKNLTEAEKTRLSTQIEELKNQYQTKEQQAQTEYQKLQKKYETDTKELTTKAEQNQLRFENKLKQVDLQAAAIKYEAINPKQVEKLIWDLTFVEPELNADGQPTGEMVTRVNWTGKDKEGNAVKLKLKVEDAIKAMTEIPDEYGNLFRNPAKGGLNGNTNNSGDSGRVGNIEQMTPQQYAANREKIRQEMNRNSQG